MTAKLELNARAWASSFRPTSSVTSLFLERFKLSIPLFLANYFAKSQNPESENVFLLTSRTLIDLLSSRKPAKDDIPALLILLKLRHSSYIELFFFKA